MTTRDKLSTPLRNLNLGQHASLSIKANGVSYITQEVVGRGSFGIVFKATCENDGETVAIKKVLQDQRFKNRELQILKELNHLNIVRLRDSFFCNEGDKVYLHLVMEHVRETIHAATKAYTKAKATMPMIFVKLYIYQLGRALGYLHSKGICHRDIKPQNLLVDAEKGILKLCDFGSAKMLGPGESSVAYICSRYYRAPELILKATKYTTAIDLWSTGCVLGEALIGTPLFPGKNTFSQLIEIVKIIGTPTDEQINIMNPEHDGQIRFTTQRGPKPWEDILGDRSSPEAVDLLSKLLCYEPRKRISAYEICAHSFFDQLRQEDTKLPNGGNLPPLFNFSEDELRTLSPATRAKLVPEFCRSNYDTSLFNQ